MLGSANLIAFVATTSRDDARALYGEILGLRLIEDTQFALVFDANGTMLRIAKVRELAPQPYTVVGWSVVDIGGTVAALMAKGVVFERYEGMTKENGIWTTPDGSRVAWFKDPDGNLLSLTAFAK